MRLDFKVTILIFIFSMFLQIQGAASSRSAVITRAVSARLASERSEPAIEFYGFTVSIDEIFRKLDGGNPDFDPFLKIVKQTFGMDPDVAVRFIIDECFDFPEEDMGEIDSERAKSFYYISKGLLGLDSLHHECFFIDIRTLLALCKDIEKRLPEIALEPFIFVTV